MPDGFEQAPDRTSRRSKVQMFALSTTPMPERYERHGQASATWPSWLVHALPDRHYGTRRSLGWSPCVGAWVVPRRSPRHMNATSGSAAAIDRPSVRV